jgi:phage-related protein
LAGVLRNINAFLNTEFGQSLLKISAAILPVLAALGLVLKVGGFFGRAVVGSFLLIQNAAGTLKFAIAALKQNFAMLTYTLGLGAGPTLLIIGAVAALIATLVLAYQKSEVFREALKTLVEGVLTALKRAFDEILAVIQEVFPNIESFGDIFKQIGDFLGKYIVPILEVVLVGAIDLVSGALKFLIRIAGALIEAFKVPFNVIKGIFALFRGDTKGAADAFKGAFEAAINYVKKIFGAFGGFFKDIINAAFIRPWNRLVGGLSFTLPKILGGGTISLPKLNELAEGGVVYPRPGGTAALLAEAGRPERIEPLDSEGLSARDRAIIAELAGPSKGTTVNMTINPSAGMDERELASIVSRQIAFQLRKGAA